MCGSRRPATVQGGVRTRTACPTGPRPTGLSSGSSGPPGSGPPCAPQTGQPDRPAGREGQRRHRPLPYCAVDRCQSAAAIGGVESGRGGVYTAGPAATSDRRTGQRMGVSRSRPFRTAGPRAAATPSPRPRVDASHSPRAADESPTTPAGLAGRRTLRRPPSRQGEALRRPPLRPVDWPAARWPGGGGRLPSGSRRADNRGPRIPPLPTIACGNYEQPLHSISRAPWQREARRRCASGGCGSAG